jgi:hypothetical protein
MHAGELHAKFCRSCNGTGDAGGLTRQVAQLSGATPRKLKAKIKWLHPVEFRRGFPWAR